MASVAPKYLIYDANHHLFLRSAPVLLARLERGGELTPGHRRLVSWHPDWVTVDVTKADLYHTRDRSVSLCQRISRLLPAELRSKLTVKTIGELEESGLLRGTMLFVKVAIDG